MKLIFKIFLICFAFNSFAQTDDIFSIADSMPKFPYGNLGLGEYFAKNMQVPAIVRENGSKGEKAYVKFVVDTSGKASNPIIIKASNYKEFDLEAIRLISKMPLWAPGSDKNKKVKVYMTLPVSYKDADIVTKTIEPVSKEHEQAMTFWSMGHKYEEEGKFENALEKFNKSLDLEPENKYSMFDKGKVLMVLEQKEKACQIWNKMVQINLRKDEAKEFIQKYCIIENGPAELKKIYTLRKATTFFTSGMNALQTDRYEAALKRFDSCLKYNPEHKDAIFNKAMMHDKLGQKIAACDTWKKLFILDPKDKETEALINKKCK